MANSVLIRRITEKTHLQPNLGEIRCQQHIKEGGEYQNQPFCGPNRNKKEAPTGSVPMGDNPPQAVTNNFLRQGGLK